MGIYRIGGFAMSKLIEKLEWVAEWGSTKKDIVCLILSGISLLLSIFGVPMPVNPAWVAIILCGVPIVLEAVIGLITAFDIKADVLVSLALIASVCICIYADRIRRQMGFFRKYT